MQCSNVSDQNEDNRVIVVYNINQQLSNNNYDKILEGITEISHI